jgi:hypothetical protein
MEATKTICQDDLATAQAVKTLGRRNAKPRAYREVMDDYIQHVDPTTNATNRERSRRMWIPEREGRGGDTGEAAGQCES